MHFKLIAATLPVFFFTVAGRAQVSPPHSETVPIYHVTVVDRAVSAVNYQYRNGPTQIDFRGTVLLPQSKGDAIVESKSGRTEIDAHFQHVETPARFGPEYLTYVLWAITPEGHPKNLGEVMANGSDKAHLHVTTDLQVFGLIVTAEPYASVRLPSDVVVLENEVRPDTIGSTQPIRARYELLPRGTYTYNVPADQAAFNAGPKVSLDKYEQIVEVYQAQNAVQIARAQGADRYAPDVYAKAVQQLQQAQQLQAANAGRTQVVTVAREAAQTAEDARTLTATRKQEAELSETKERLARERQLRADAEAAAQRSEAQAQADRNAAEAERNARHDAEARNIALATAAPPPPPPPQSFAAAPPAQSDENRRKMNRRITIFRELNGTMETLDTSRGLVATVRDSDFRGPELNAGTAANVARFARSLAAEPGLAVEVDGYTDSPGNQAENLANERAQSVLDALLRGGLQRGATSVRGMGNSRPLTSNATAAGHEQNRRIEIVVSGDSLGVLPAWEKTYTLNVQP